MYYDFKWQWDCSGIFHEKETQENTFFYSYYFLSEKQQEAQRWDWDPVLF